MEKELRRDLDLDYDSEGDVLYVFLGPPYPTVNYELDANFLLQLDPQTKELVGLTIHPFSDLFPQAHRSEDHALIAGSLLTLFSQLLREKKLREPIVA